MRYFSSLGMTLLTNSHTVIERQSAKLVVAGITDFSAPATGFALPDVGRAIQGAPKDASIVLLDYHSSQGVSLQLSGSKAASTASSATSSKKSMAVERWDVHGPKKGSPAINLTTLKTCWPQY